MPFTAPCLAEGKDKGGASGQSHVVVVLGRPSKYVVAEKRGAGWKERLREGATPGPGRSRAWTVDKEPVIRIRMKIDLIRPKRHARRPKMWKTVRDKDGVAMSEVRWRMDLARKGEDLVKGVMEVTAGLGGPRRGLTIWN